jgi:hypothetical protein
VKKKILIALPFGQTIRDVLRSDTFKVLKQQKDVILVVVSSASKDDSFQQEFGGENVEFEYLGEYKPNRFELLFQSFYLSTLAFKSNTIRLYSQVDKKSALRFFIPLSNLASKLIGRFNLQKLLGYFLRVSNISRPYEAMFEKHNPDLVVVTRVLRASPDYPILKEATLRKLPVIALVSSWDNFTTKGFFPFGVKKLVVWNDVMKQEAIELFGFPEENILVTGIPRFDTYFKKPPLRSREEFFSDYELDTDKKLVTYTTGNKSLVLPPGDNTSAEVEVAGALAKAISTGKIPNAQLLVRLHPLAEYSDFEPLDKIESVTVQVPGKVDKFRDRLFSAKDDLEIAETLKHSDLILNVASTMTIDSAVFDTPSLSVSYDARRELPFLHSCKRIYEYEHYRKLRETGGVHMVHSESEMLEEVYNYLADPSLNEDGRRAIIEQQCKFTDGKAGARVGQGILEYLETL